MNVSRDATEIRACRASVRTALGSRTHTASAKPATLDREYFTNYCGEGPYSANYRFYSGIEHCLSTLPRLGARVESVCVLGAATGEILRDFRRAWGVRPRGCEISRWAHEQIPRADRARIACSDMRSYIPACVRRREHFDLVFSNSLVYLEAREVPELLGQCRKLCHYFHFLSSTTEAYEPGDRRRITLRSRAWWRARFLEAGFRPTRSPYVFR